MPSVSGKQHRLMELVAHNPSAAARLHIPQKVGQDFAQADIGRHFPRSDGRPAPIRAEPGHTRHPR